MHITAPPPPPKKNITQQLIILIFNEDRLKTSQNKFGLGLI